MRCRRLVELCCQMPLARFLPCQLLDRRRDCISRQSVQLNGRQSTEKGRPPRGTSASMPKKSLANLMLSEKREREREREREKVTKPKSRFIDHNTMSTGRIRLILAMHGKWQGCCISTTRSHSDKHHVYARQLFTNIHNCSSQMVVNNLINRCIHMKSIG